MKAFPFIVPMIKNINTNKYEINMQVIENTIEYVKDEIYRLAKNINRNEIIRNLDLHENIKVNSQNIVKHLWNCESNG